MNWFHHHKEHDLNELVHKLRELVTIILGENMSQVQYTLTLTVTPAVTPLTEGATSGSATLQANTQGSDILTPITGGVPPYTASVDASSPNQLPPGVTVGIDQNNNLIVSGTAATAGTGTILIDVNDSAVIPVANAKRG
jgi:hypothetical protein